MVYRVDGVARAGVSKRWVLDWIKAATVALKRPGDDLAVIFVSSGQIKKLNTVYRSKPVPTDVLSFPAETKADLGDIFIAPAVAKKKAALREISYRDYLKLLIVHSILHLGGYDHHTEKESRLMERMEEKILKIGAT